MWAVIKREKQISKLISNSTITSVYYSNGQNSICSKVKIEAAALIITLDRCSYNLQFCIIVSALSFTLSKSLFASFNSSYNYIKRKRQRERFVRRRKLSRKNKKLSRPIVGLSTI